MPDFTTRLGLYKPGGGSTGLITPDEVVDIDKLNSNSDKIDASIGSKAVTSTSRPSVPFDGQIALESDTGNLIVWDGAGSYWRPGVSVPYCANATVRDAFYPNPKQGNRCYRADLGIQQQYYEVYDSSTNKNGWVVAGWRSLLTSGWNLITPDSVAGTGVTVASDGAVVLAAASSASINKCFWGLFTEYMVELNLNTLSGATPSSLAVRLRAAGADLSSASYNWAMQFANSTTPGAAFQLNQTSWQAAAGITATDMEAELLFTSPAEAKRTLIRVRAAAASVSTILIGDMAGINTANTAYDGFTISTISGSMTGTMKIFGLYRGGV